MNGVILSSHKNLLPCELVGAARPLTCAARTLTHQVNLITQVAVFLRSLKMTHGKRDTLQFGFFQPVAATAASFANWYLQSAASIAAG